MICRVDSDTFNRLLPTIKYRGFNVQSLHNSGYIQLDTVNRVCNTNLEKTGKEVSLLEFCLYLGEYV